MQHWNVLASVLAVVALRAGMNANKQFAEGNRKINV